LAGQTAVRQLADVLDLFVADPDDYRDTFLRQGKKVNKRYDPMELFVLDLLIKNPQNL